MTHVRQQIREAVVALLIGNTAAGNRVYASRVYPLDDGMLPAILVYTNNEETATETITRPRSQSRTLTLQIEIYAKATGNVDEVTDTIAGEIEEAIADAPSLNGLCKDIRLTATTVQLTGEGEKPVAVMALNFAVFYRTFETAPDIPI